MSEENYSFSPLRQYLWPVKMRELKKFIPLFCIAFFISFNYNVLRNIKDALLVTAKDSGAEVIPFIQIWGIVPCAFLITFIYGKLNNKLSRNRVFYAMISLFLTFFAFFTFVIYPLGDKLHLHTFANWLQNHLPVGCKGLVAMVRYWTFSSFYIMSELWSTTILSMLFWGFMNQITKMHQAKRFYSLISTGLNIASIISGQVSVLLCSCFLARYVHLSANPLENSLIMVTLAVLGSGFAILLSYAYLTEKVLPQEEQEIHFELKSKSKVKISLIQSITYLLKSRYLLFIGLIVLSYNVIINLVAVTWKDQVRQLYPNPLDYSSYMGHISTLTGALGCALSFLASGQLIRRFGWRFVALIPPLILLFTSIGFFTCFFAGHTQLMGIFATFGTSPLTLTVFFGTVQNILSRATKYTLFDATKEMAFIPLSEECKLKGKAVIDGVGSRLGKSGGSCLLLALLISFNSITESAPFIAGLLLIFIGIWIVSVQALGKQFLALTEKPSEELSKAPKTPATV